MSSPISLEGKRLLVTGSARGLGRAFAEAMIAAGAKVMVADILTEEGQATADAIGAGFVHLDLIDPESVEACMEATVSELGGLDGLVNNGAIATDIGGPAMTEIDIDVWDRVMTVNVRGTWLMSKAAVPHLAQSCNGKIVNLASDTALWGAPRLMHYVASKGAVLSMTRSMARELGEDGIAVNSIAPGLTAVEATEYVPEDRKSLYVDNRPFTRTQMPEDVTGAVLFLVSDAASFITGQCIPVNGGFVMR
ncbi:MAG: short-chain dehydrogenase [Rhodospirillaceae bacterium]|nr:short-chain dehydrogenase [Rhodospirillaceae bacterium]